MFGGVANYWANLCRFLPGDDFLVLAPEYNNSLEFDIRQNYLIYRKELISKSKWIWPKWLPLLFQMYKLVRAEQVKKIIVAHVLPTGTAAYLLKKLLGVSYIVSIHGLDIALPRQSRRKTWLMKKIFREASQIIANSNFTKGKLLEMNCCHADDITVIYPCPSLGFRAMTSERRQYLEDKLNLKNKKIILTVGRLIERKGQDKVIEALPQVLAKVPNVVYLIVGQGEKREQLQQSAAALGIDKQVRFFTDVLDCELPEFYHLADVFVMPCRELENGDIEGFGIVYLEANCYGKPVIGGRSGGAVEAIEHGVNGLLVDPESTNEIGQAIISLLVNEKKAEELADRGKRRVAMRFDWAVQARELVKILN